ncbi:hypothetical protein [Saccharomonospora piscinae]|uniref:hypothetical protein n=1 Tax=Saccharomonospora piscinae TaxID=687388 RepID=UPI0004641224|nr:hypothetical protein [Saccharomonospora piscinae]
MTDTGGAEIHAALWRGLRIAVLLVAVVVLVGLSLPNLVRRIDTYEPSTAQWISFAALAAVLAVEAVLVVGGRTWARLRVPAIALVLAASALSYATLPDGKTSTAVDWVFGVANWVGLVVLLDRPLRTLLAFLAAHEVTAVVNLVVSDEVSRAAVLRLATGSVSVLGYPLCAAVVTTALHRIATSSASARREADRVRTEEAVAVETHRRRRQRLAELSATTTPLLEGLARGDLSPEDAAVQRRCAIEAARMRRLFAEVDAVPDPLLHEIRHCADIADRKGVLVELDSRGKWPTPPLAVRRDLTEPALTALATASSTARVTVTGDAELVSVSVVADCGTLDVADPATPGVRVESFTDEDTTWMEVRWQPIRRQTLSRQ